MNTPILFLIFNRPDLTERVFERIREARPARLFVAADGPRADRAGEAELCEETRRVLARVDWPCEVKTLFREQNVGCKLAVSTAIDWFFEHVESGIILEDDCLPDVTFFAFCDELLDKYRDDERIIAIGGSNYQNGKTRGHFSYYFSKYPHIWGWATWRRAWQHMDVEMQAWPALRDTAPFRSWFYSTREERFWRNAFEMAWSGKIDTWDYAWLFSCWKQQGVAILPNVNLVENIGFDLRATHTDGRPAGAPLRSETLGFPLQHPAVVKINAKADRYTDKVAFSGHRDPLILRIRRKWWKLCLAMKRG